MLAGLVFMALTFPSAYLRARINFSEQRGRAPLTMYEIHLMQVFEQIVLFNGVYKIPMYLLFLRTFRKANIWVDTGLVKTG
nr:hypothetical protein BaRGS_004848 [Batillaria attramentaria]